MSKELEYFRRVAGDTGLVAWLEREKETTLATLAVAEGSILFRAQGRYKLLSEILERVNAAKDLR